MENAHGHGHTKWLMTEVRVQLYIYTRALKQKKKTHTTQTFLARVDMDQRIMKRNHFRSHKSDEFYQIKLHRLVCDVCVEYFGVVWCVFNLMERSHWIRDYIVIVSTSYKNLYWLLYLFPYNDARIPILSRQYSKILLRYFVTISDFHFYGVGVV